MEKKIVISDYDQTFYLNNEDIQKNIIAVDKLRNSGNVFVIATGRSYLDFIKKVKLYNIKYDYVIINHGATILDNKDNILINYFINNKIIDGIKEDLRLEVAKKHFSCSVLETRLTITNNNLTKINVMYNSEQEALAINNLINKKYYNYINSYYVGYNEIEIISSNTSKDTAIDFLLDKLRINACNTYTIGDGYSDIKMVKKYNGYAIKNYSIIELKKVAKKEYNSVHEMILKEVLKDENK